jgi:hypothetical protein
MTVVAVSIRGVGEDGVRAVELRQILAVLPGAEECDWMLEIEDMVGGATSEAILRRSELTGLIDGPEIRRFADDVTQTHGGQFIGTGPGSKRSAIDVGLLSTFDFDASPIRYIVRDVRGDEWIIVARDQGDIEPLRRRFAGVCDEDPESEFLSS